MSSPSTKAPLFKRAGLASALALALAGGAALSPLGDVFSTSTPAYAQVLKPEAGRPVNGPASFAPVVKAVAPAVVHIEVTQRAGAGAAQGQQNMEDLPPGMREFFERFFGDRMPFNQPGQPGPQRPVTGLGSGFVIDAAGYIVTNNHVVANAESMLVTFADGDQYQAELIGVDSRTDLALIKVNGDEPFAHVAWGDSDAAEVGDWIVAVGNPFGLDHTVTTGIISARGRSIGAGPYDDFLQIDAPINKGNSGGPAFNLAGEVVGVNTAIFSPTGGSVGIGFAIPSNMAKTVIAQLKETGSVERGWLGVAIQTVTEDIAEGAGLEKAEGAIVSNVTADGPAAEGGLKVGDVILSVNGERIEEMPELPRVIADIEPGATADIQVWRNGEMQTLAVELGTLPDETTLAAVDTPAPQMDDALGLTLAPLDPAARRAAGVDEDAEGVLIAGVSADSPLAGKGVQAGAVLLSVAGEPVATPDAAAAQLRQAKESGKASVLLLIRQNNADRFVAAPLQQG